jgi:hypothetical protein
MSDLSEQLNLNNQINEAIKQRSMLVGDLTRLLSDQNSIAKELCESLKCIDTEKLNSNLVNTKDAVNSLKQASKESTESLGNMGETIKKKPRILNDATKAMGGFVAGGLSAKLLGKVFDSLKGKLKAAFIGIKSIGSALGGFGKAVLSFPFKMLSGLIEMSNDLGRVTELTKAFEDVREKFGDLEKGTSKILKDSLRPMVKQFNQTADAGHSFAKTFGRGPAGLANALKFNAELMEKLNGGTAELRQQIGDNIAAMAIYRKGMGFTADQQATLVALADAQGKNIVNVQHEYAKFSLQMGKRFGLDSKLIGKSMADMTADVGNFGTLSTRQLAQVATYTQKLGIETKALQGVIKKYDDFESAAKSAAMLNQTFGMQVDVMKMMKDEDPASRLSQLQKSFQATGKSYEQLSRAERNRLADLAGLDAKSAELAFSQKGLSMSYDDIQSAGEESETSFADINDTLKELSKNMKKIFEEPQRFKSFFEAFSRGFNKGFVLGPRFMGVMKNIRSSLISTENAGRMVGRMFQAMMPGVDKVIEGLEKFFNPAATKDGLGKMMASIDKFFNTLKGGPKVFKQALKDLWTDLSQDFMNFFGGKGEATSTLLDGLGQFYSNIINFALSFGSIIVDVFSKGLRNVTKVLRGQMSFKELFGIKSNKDLTAGLDIGGTLKKTFGDSFNELIASFKNELWPALKDAFSAIVDVVLVPFWKNTLWPWIKTLPGLFWGAISDAFKDGSYLKAAAIILAPFLIIFGPKAVVGFLGKTMLKTFGAIAGKVGGLFSTSISKGANKGVEKASSKAGKGGAKSGGIGKAVGGLAHGVLAGAAKGLMAFANPLVLKGAGILAGSIVLIGGAIAAAAWLMGKALPTLGEGLKTLNEVDGINLVIVGTGLAALGVGLTAMAAGSIGAAVSGLLQVVTGKSAFEGVLEFSELNIDGEKVEKNANAVVAFSHAMAKMGVGQAMQAIGQTLDGIASFVFGSPILNMQTKITQFESLKINPNLVRTVSDGLAVFGEGMKILNSIDIPRITGGGALGAIANFFAGAPDIKTYQPFIEQFESLKFSIAKIKVNSEGAVAFGEGVNALNSISISRTIGKGYLDEVADFWVGKPSIANFQPFINEFQALSFDKDKLKTNSEGAVAFGEGVNALNSISISRTIGKGYLDEVADFWVGKPSILGFQHYINEFQELCFNEDKLKENAKGAVAFGEGVDVLNKVSISRTIGKGYLDEVADFWVGKPSIASFQDFINEFQELCFKVDKLQENTKGAVALGEGLKQLNSISIPTTDEGVIDKLWSSLVGKKSISAFQIHIDAYQGLKFKDDDLNKVSSSLVIFSTGMKTLSGIEIPRSGGLFDRLGSVFQGEKGLDFIEEQIKHFQRLEMNKSLIQNNADATTHFANAMKSLAEIKFPTSGGIFAALNSNSINMEKLGPVITKFQDLDVNVQKIQSISPGIIKLAEALKAIADIQIKQDGSGTVFSSDVDLGNAQTNIDIFQNLVVDQTKLSTVQADLTMFGQAMQSFKEIKFPEEAAAHFRNVRNGIDDYNTVVEKFKTLNFSKDAIDTKLMEEFDTTLKTYSERITVVSQNIGKVFSTYADALPNNVLDKVYRVVDEVTKMEETFKQISNKQIVATAIKIGESFSGNSTVTFQHENININLEVAVQMSAEDLLRGIIKTTVKGTDGKADREVRVVTDPSDPFAT